MSASVRATRLVNSLFASGFKRAAALLATIIFPGRSFSIDKEGRWVCRYKSGETIVSPDVFLSRRGFLEESVTSDWLPFYAPQFGDVVVDVGAGVGTDTLVFAGSGAQVIAIEAHPGTFACLEETVRRSGLDNVTPLMIAITDKDGEIMISSDTQHLANSVVLKSSSGQIVEARSLESLMTSLKLRRIDFLKVNIEGAERLLVKGLGNLKIRHLVVSCHDFTGIPEQRTREEVRQALAARGFVLLERTTSVHRWTRDNVYARSDDIPH